jgi:colanic acid/amylovoran biosynthesis glycosyltransferase
MSKNDMLLVVQVPFRRLQDRLQVEQQAANGIRQWASHFEGLVVCASCSNCLSVSNANYIDAEDANFPMHVQLIPLPSGDNLLQNIQLRSQVRQILEPLVSKSRYLQFAIGGCSFADWAAIAARIAERRNRAYAVHTDWVTHLVKKKQACNNLKMRLRNSVEWRLMRYCERKIIRSSSLGLFHGADCFEFYRQWQKNAHLIHDIHVAPSKLISLEAVAKKCQRAIEGGPVRLCYIGRMWAMKGPRKWLETLRELKRLGIDFTATWMGEGDERPMMESLIDEFDLSSEVALRKFDSNQSAVIDLLRESDLFLFCHLTPESPRNLIESLNQATPIIGFESAYSKDLTTEGGGQLVPMGDVGSLAAEIKRLSDQRQQLLELIKQAQRIGTYFTDNAVFEHRSNLIKTMPFHAS